MFTLVLPTYNEAQNIAACIDAACKVLAGREFEIIVADDNSPDGTWKIAEELNNPHVRVLRRTSNPGLSPAVVDAFNIARGDLLGVMDADLQHDESILPKMIDALADHDFVAGSRKVPGGSVGDWSLHRRFTSWVAAKMAHVLVHAPLTDPMTGFFAIRREVFERAKPYLAPRGFKIPLEILCLGQPKSIAEIPYTFRTRKAGQSKLSTKVMKQYVSTLFELRRKMATIRKSNSCCT